MMSELDTDVVVVGAGFAGLYLLHRLRGMGVSATVLEAADDVGGTWYWNRYPGARCDIRSLDYSYSFDPELEQEWEWSEKFATQPEILRYLQHVADRHDLRKDIEFSNKVTSAVWDEESSTWKVSRSGGDPITCRWFVMATGCLSEPKAVDIPGVETFTGPTYFNSRWPHEGVDFSGMKVAVIGTGSSAIQSIPLIAEQASQLTVFQRTANFSVPAHNGAIPADEVAEVRARYPEYREEARYSRGGVTLPQNLEGAQMVSADERNARLERAWAKGDLQGFLNTFPDTMLDEDSNRLVAEFIHDKIRAVVEDPETAESLCAKDHPVGSKRLCLDTNYFATYNLPHVRLVDLKNDPITEITPLGITTASEAHEFDAIVYATGFDAMTGAIVAVDMTGRNGLRLEDKWADGPATYLGLTVRDFPNFFAITGPQSPSVLSNMAVSIEQHVEWVSDTIETMRDRGFTSMNPTETAEAGWQQHCQDCADLTIFTRADSWYMGANVPGKPRTVLPYLGGVDTYRKTCDKVAENDFFGFELRGPDQSLCNDGVVNRLMPDVAMVLDIMAQMGLPPLESMSPEEARGFMTASAEQSPPGPDVGEVLDGTYPGADGQDMAYRLYRPATPGPHPVVAYFHGGGWVLGGADSDDALCRDLCNQSNSIIVSADYRHAPEHPFPAAVDDGYAAVTWISDNAESLGGLAGSIVVAGWSAGANVATVAAQTARDNNSPAIAGQVLLHPVTDSDMSRASYVENAEGYVLTTALMTWFWDHYCDAADRTDPRAAPIRGDLAGLPPTLVVTAEFDPLRDEGAAYVEALQAAGVDARGLPLRGQTHTSIGGVGLFISPRSARAEVAETLASFASATVG